MPNVSLVLEMFIAKVLLLVVSL
ncbi:hypothetical protein C369_07264 [Cryptococcus neoformans A5-35-17]|nr:hypothetical protein C369_07264 [Cryptococcus neoformans var. grubii A5-35-17]